MKAPSKIGVVVAGILCVAAMPVAYHYRHQLRRLAHEIRHAGRNPINSSWPVTNSVEFNGKSFRDVLGYPPYYLNVPQLNSVVFVTRLTSGGSNVFHVLNLKTGQDVQIPTIADFGRSIGLTNGAFLEYVEKVEPGKINLASESGVGVAMKTVFHLNLQTASMDGRDIYFYDQHGNVTNLRHAPGF